MTDGRSPSALDPTLERRIRVHLCLSHGHSQQYLDDGELQCQECRQFGQWDYRRAPIAALLDTVEAVGLARIAAEIRTCSHKKRRVYDPETGTGDESDYQSRCILCARVLRDPPNV